MADTNAIYKVIGDGTVPNVTPGTAVQFNSGTALGCRMVRVTALAENKGAVAIGGSTVKATAGGGRGMQLSPGQSADFSVADVSMLYMDALNAGDAVAWLYFKTTD